MTATTAASALPATFAAIDLGATSGRVVLGRVGEDHLDLTEAHRFANRPVRLPSGLHWDILALHQGVVDGLRAAARSGPPISVGVDTWAVDYALLDSTGALLGNPHHYRDERTRDAARRIHRHVGPAELYRTTGLQHLDFNTIHQLAAAQDTPQLRAAHRLLLIPDLIAYWLTGQIGAEETNASTTGLYDARTRQWSHPLLKAAGVPADLMPPLRRPGDTIGTLLPYVAEHTGLSRDTPVTAVASHDTASAVVAVPASDPAFAYISCGTWSLAGLELDAPVLTEASRAANFTNELGIDDTVRYLRNIMGLWLLSETQRTWQAQGRPWELEPLLAGAATAEPFAAVIDPDAPEFLAPGDMPARIAEYCGRTGQRPPADPASLVRTILEALALAHARTLRAAADLTGRDIAVVHLVGGGSRNELLCQLTADALGLPVVAGPAEATALGNILVQARTAGSLRDLTQMRKLVADTQHLRHYLPRGTRTPWHAAAARIGLA